MISHFLKEQEHQKADDSPDRTFFSEFETKSISVCNNTHHTSFFDIKILCF